MSARHAIAEVRRARRPDRRALSWSSPTWRYHAQACGRSAPSMWTWADATTASSLRHDRETIQLRGGAISTTTTRSRRSRRSLRPICRVQVWQGLAVPTSRSRCRCALSAERQTAPLGDAGRSRSSQAGWDRLNTASARRITGHDHSSIYEPNTWATAKPIADRQSRRSGRSSWRKAARATSSPPFLPRAGCLQLSSACRRW